MKALNLGRVEDFPFIDPPDGRLVRDGYETLLELGAISEDGDLTPLGAKLAKLPIDPRLGRMILAATEEGAMPEVLVITAALAVEVQGRLHYSKWTDREGVERYAVEIVSEEVLFL